MAKIGLMGEDFRANWRRQEEALASILRKEGLSEEVIEARLDYERKPIPVFDSKGRITAYIDHNTGLYLKEE